ncbi:hypothetical protein BpHYR1_018096 [Brachionus plicatilis]|uniref:Uncharacterized protein n=1 Tax=Brachionus plicatilis TaxID=10195 RepID=A0A3M7SL90_BRAPC|nr:hypothetical protein BpHYR1_018096 [Brachionus plicatilis]
MGSKAKKISFKSVVGLVEEYRDRFELRNMKLHNPTPLFNCYLNITFFNAELGHLSGNGKE